MKRTATLFKALADTTRLRILLLIATEGRLCVCDIMAALALPQSTVSRHLAYLRGAGWLEDRREGVWVYYSLRNEGDPFDSSLLDLLRDHLFTDPVAVRDRHRLHAFTQGRACA